MTLSFTAKGWADYLNWQRDDKAILKRINRLIADILRGPFDGVGKPEPLRHDLTGGWSRRIDSEHRLVYEVQDDVVVILACRFHYTS